MWVTLFTILFVIYAWGCAFEFFRWTCAQNKRFDEKFDLYMESQRE